MTKLFPGALLVNPTKFLGEINVPQEVLQDLRCPFVVLQMDVTDFRIFSLFFDCLHVAGGPNAIQLDVLMPTLQW